MNFFKTALAAIALALPLAVTPAVAGSAKKDIVDTAVSAGQFTTLVAAVKAAGLVETLKGKGPFTVFAPTDAAFKKLQAASVQGQKISIDATKGVKVDGANVVKADIATSNGVIHVIDAVILPKS